MRRRTRFVATLGAAASTIGVLVAAPPAQAAEDPMCRTTQGGDPWYPGPSASTTYDSTFRQSVAIPQGLIDGRYVPQGLTYWNNWNGTEEDVLLISAYRQADWDDSLDGPSAIFGVVLSGSRRGQGLGRMLIPSTHAGGVALVGNHVYVAGEGGVRWWSARTVRASLEGPNNNTIPPAKGTKNILGKGSFIGSQGGTFWTGNHNISAHDHMWQYRVDPSTGTPTYTGGTRWVPKKTQGMTTVGDRFVFATSWGRNDRSNVWVRPTSATGSITDGSSFCMRAPSMIEGLAYGNSGGNRHVWALYESGAWAYNRGLDDPDNPIKHIHWANGSTLAGLYGQPD